MRIGILTDSVAADPWSGVGSYARNLIREWSRAHEVVSLGRVRRAPVAGFAGHIRVSRWSWGWRRQAESGLDAVLCPQARDVPDFFYRIDRPRLVTIHGATVFLFAGTGVAPPPTSSILRHRERPEAVELYLTVSQSAQKEIVEHYQLPAERVVPIYNGVDTQLFSPPADKEQVRQEARSRFGLPGRYLLHVSNYQPKKNGVRIVAAYRRLRKSGFRGLALVLAGGAGWGFEPVAEEIARVSDGQVVRLGQLQGADLALLYRGAEVFLFPSLHESFGLPALEAMACGVPTVVSTVFSLPEVAGDAAVQVNPESVEEIAQAVQKLLSDPALYERYRQAGVKRAWEFRWEDSARRHVEAFERARTLWEARHASSPGRSGRG